MNDLKNLLKITEKTHSASPFLQVILLHRKGHITLESAFAELKACGIIKEQITYTEFLQTLCAVAYTRIIPTVPILTIEKAIVAVQKERRNYLREQRYLKATGKIK